MGKIFISYRRADSRKDAGRIYDRLIEEFDEDNIFKDVNTIPTGEDFRTIIRSAILNSDVVLVIIGNKWSDITDENGNRRLDDVSDFVRIEIVLALQENKMVIPVLIDNTSMPNTDDLPSEMQQLAYKNAAIVRDDPDFSHDVSKLIDDLQRIFNTLEIKSDTKSKRSIVNQQNGQNKLLIPVLVMIVIAVTIFLFIGRMIQSNPSEQIETARIVFERRIRDYDGSPPDDFDLYIASQQTNSEWSIEALTNDRFSDKFASPSPDGSQIAFISNRAGGVDSVVWDIWLINTDGTGEMMQITDLDDSSETGIEWSQIGWAPDGESIVFARFPSGEEGYEIYILSLDSIGHINEPLISDSTGSYLSPDWSSSGRFLTYYGRSDDCEPNSIYIYDFNSRRSEQITFPPEQNFSCEDGRIVMADEENELIQDIHPSWSPDERAVVFQRGRDIYRIDIDDNGNPLSEPVRLTSSDSTDWEPGYSPDGQYIAYYHGGIDSIRIMDANLGDSQVIGDVYAYPESGTGTDRLPRWIP